MRITKIKLAVVADLAIPFSLGIPLATLRRYLW